MAKPWEKFQKSKVDPSPKKDSAEDKGPWKMFEESVTEQQRLDRELGEEVADRIPDLALLGAQGATFGHLDEAQGFLKTGEFSGPDYEQARNDARSDISEARQRQGFLGDVAETVGSTVTSVAVPALRGGTFLKEVGLAALQGMGEAEEMEDVGSKAVTSSLVSAGTQMLSKGMANKMFGEPDDILARTSGARGINFRDGDTEMKDPAKVAARLDKLGFFKPGDRVFDPNTKSFILNTGTGSKLDSYVKPQSLKEFTKRADIATKELGQQNARLLKGKRIPVSEVDDILVDAAYDFIPDGADVASRTNAAVDLTTEVVRDLRSRGVIKNGYIPAEEIQKVKQFMQQKVAKTYRNQGIADITNDGIEVRRTYATKLDKLLDKYGGQEYAENNDLMHDLFLQKEMIHNKVSRQRGYGVEAPALTRPKWTDKVQDAIDTPAVGVMRARVGQGLETDEGKMFLDSLNRLPVEFYNNRESRGRSPQSVPNIPEELIRTPLPRTTEGMMSQKNFVLAKIAQMAPDMLESVKDVYDNDPEMISQLAPVIAQRLPQFFERDKYNRFDGRIMSEKDKARAIKDTLGDTRLSTIEQAKIITKLNKEGLYDR
jgi:hypothetical protein